jgi:hypothetical protein
MAKGGKSGGMSPKDASRIQKAGDRNPNSKTAQTGFASRAQSSGAKNTNTQGKK